MSTIVFDAIVLESGPEEFLLVSKVGQKSYYSSTELNLTYGVNDSPDLHRLNSVGTILNTDDVQ